jgi:enamine deaminase RidA (YjgF/YER057c/UK114 family)
MATQAVTDWKKEWFEIEDATYLNTAAHTAMPRISIRAVERSLEATPDFTESHEVANGASELLCEVFGERGAHARTSHGGAQIPFGSCVEIEMIVEVAHSDSECQV